MNYQNPIRYILKEKDNLYSIATCYKTTVPSILSLNNNLDPYNLQTGSAIFVQTGENLHTHANNPDCSYTYQENVLNNKMRLVWCQHVYWTRMVLISIAERLKDLNATSNRLLQNPNDIAKIYGEYYSKDVSAVIAQLLTEHLEIGAELITALRDNKNSEANSLNKQWYTNADKMAEAFSSINPYYNRDEVRKMFYTHLELTTQEVSMRLAGNYIADIQAFGKSEEEMMMMADYFTTGIVQQFPQKFF